MDVNWLVLRSFFLSLLLHGLFAALLVFSFSSQVRHVVKPAPRVNIVRAVSVDKKQVEKELKRLQEIDRKKSDQQKKQQRELARKLKELERKSARATKKRKAEEKKLAELKKKKVKEQKEREEEQNKLARLKKEKAEIDRQRKEAAEKKRKAEAQRKKQAALKKKEAELRKRKMEAEKKREAQEQRLQKELAEEQKQLEAEQKNRDQQLLQNIVANIKRRIVNNFNKSGLPKGLECVLSVRLVPGGEVVSVTVSKSSGNDIFDRRALVAVEKASPLPIPEDAAVFARLNLRQFAFRFRPED